LRCDPIGLGQKGQQPAIDILGFLFAEVGGLAQAKTEARIGKKARLRISIIIDSPGSRGTSSAR
jgi:F0F1-type ATP synthase alpha subunit